MNVDNRMEVSDDLNFLARGPLRQARRFDAYNINGFKFRTVDREEGFKTQNSGIFTVAELGYYGKLVDIIELNYHGLFTVVLFKCKWVNTNRGIRKDPLQFTSVNFSRLIHTGEREEHDPYILASQAQMVYYVDDEVEQDWSVVVHLKPRDLYDMGEEVEEIVCETEPHIAQDFQLFFSDDVETISLAREDADDEAILMMDPDNNVDNEEENI